ncbi:protein piccolo isoform X4 [Lucilia cuprina]|uniref:protein piccolo isoform X4 n=1 Tax=Lucilia cuprina TaxID=7375 RepID=UPI001F05DB24|nr:protein piccolo isoform X4 [Lucilia cuprina]
MSYRSSYTPWKSSLSPNYKTGASSAYSSRDDVSATSRYSSLASPSSYRPSFSGGTYRLKRDTPIVPTSTYVSRYSAATSSPATKPDTSSTSDSSGSKPGQLKRYGSSASSLGKYSREPSPAALEHTNRIKSRDPSPATRSLRGKSRDPSPALDTKCKIGYGSSASSYRMNVPKSTTGNTYGTRYGSSSTAGRTPAANNSSTSISYLSASDFKARSISKAREAATRKSNEKELEAQKTEEKEENKPEATSNEESTGSSETDEEDDEEEEDNEEKFVSVAVCTRATSPTPPGTAPTVHRTRRIEIAKTIEKTIQRSTRKKKMLEKEIQSDRLDDSTRYSRFGLSSRVSSPYSPHTERYTSSSLRYSHSPLSTTASKSSSLNSTSESKKDDVSASSTSASSKANKSPLNSKSKLSPPKSIKITSRQSSMENLSAHKPPAAPKGESPTKSISSSTGVSTKLPNKDFRKSALNVGPTDRPRKSRTPSTGTDSDLNTVEALNGALQAIQRLERSPSAGSEVSNASNRSIRRTGTDSKLRPRCHNKSFVNGSVVSPKSPLSRNNSTSNIKAKSSTSTSSTTTQSSAGTTTTTSSSSGTESCTESKKSTKKIIKKKAIKDVTNTSSSTSTTATTTSPTTHSTADSRSIKSSSENSFSQQPPAASVNNQKAKKSDSSATNSRTTPKTPSDKDPLRRLKKLSSVSNFFAAQQQDNANNDEQIYLESSENSSSGNDLDRSLSKKSISLTQANETKTTPSPAVKTKTSGSSSKSNPNYTINSIDEPKNSIKTTKSTSSTSSTKTKTKTKSKSNTKSSSTSTSYCPQETTTVNESSIMPSELQTESLSPYTTTNPTTSSTSGTDQEESSWWQDTSRQIDTASALDFNLKDEMRFKIRHIDSGETAWWLRNDEDDTLADDDLKTLNQEEELEEDEDDEEEATDHIQSLTSTPSGNAAKLNDKPGGWWITNETNDETPNEDEEKHETIYVKSRSSNDLDYPSNGYCVEEAPVEAKPFPKSRITPETDWWNDDNEEAQAEYTVNNNPSLNSDKTSNKSGNNLSQLSDKLPKQNGSIQLKICRVESGEKPWWLQEEQQTETQPQENEITVEATIALPKKNKDKTDSSSSNSDSKNRWMSGPTKKVFNIPRVESGEKAWWQEETSESKSDKASENKNYKRNNSQEQEWWLEESSQQQKPPTTPQHNYQQNGYFEPPAPIQQQQQQYYHNTEEEAELQQYQHSSYNHNNLIDSQAELSNSFNFEYSERPPPLGQCASPVQQEELLPPPPPQQRQQCTSPYDNIPMTKVQTAASQQPILETSTNYMASGGGGGPIYQQDIVYLNQSPLQQQPQQQYFPHQRQQQQHQQNPNYLQQPPTPYNQYNNNELRSRNGQLFISRHQNIDELLGGSCRPISPLYYDNNSFQTMPPQLQPQQTPTPSQQRNMFVEEITPDQVRIHDSTAQMPIIQRMERDDWQRDSLAAKPTTPPRFEQRMIDDAAIQVYKDGDYGSYLDLESSLAEQSEEIEGLNSSRKNSLVVRTQLSVRVHAIIEKLLSAEGSDLRRALFSLKQVFQEDKDLVHAFVALGGLNCLVRVGNGADQNYQNYILRALGQVMLYVDGMNGVMKHEPTMQWLYSLIASNYRSVVKTALKLLLVFVEYAESNCHVLVSAIHAVDKQQGTLPWSNIMRLLKDYDNADAELVIYAASLINKTLEGLNDQDSFYDESDLLEQQGMESVIQHYMSKPGTDMDLLNQLQLYEAVLKFEDGESDGTRLPDNTLRKTQRFRSSTDTAERRKSRRHSTGTSPGNINKVLPTHMRLTPTQPALDEDSSSSTNSAEFSGGVFAEKKPRDGAGVTPGLRRRRERAERHRSFLKEQQEAAAAVAANGYMNSTDNREDMAMTNPPLASGFDYIPQTSTPHTTPVKYAATTTTMEDNTTTTTYGTPSTPRQRVMSPNVSSYPVQNAYNNTITTTTSVAPPPPPPPPPPPDLWGNANNMRMPPPPPPPPPPPYFYHQHSNNMSYNQNTTTNNIIPNSNQANNAVNTTNNNLNSNSDQPVDLLQINESDNEDKKLLLQLKRDHTVKDLTQKLCNLPTSPTTQDDKLQNRIVGDMSGLISKAKEGLAKSKSKGEMSRSSSVDQEIKKPEPKKSENDLQWEELVRNISRPLNLCDLDFTDLNSEDEKDILAPRGFGRGIPPPPPPIGGVALPPPMMPTHLVCPPPMNHPMSMSNTSNGSGALIPPPMFSYSGYGNTSLTNSFNSSMNGSINGDMSSMNTIKKNKKTVKLFWKEVREDLIPVSVGKTIWDELPAANVDTQKLEHLFESRAKDLMTKEKQQEMNKSKEVIVLDHKRSNAINIAMTKLPPPRAIKAAILKMDATVVTREGIDKLLNMLPTDEEKGKIQEAQMANPELPLGSAEQFLLTLASISELAARLRLWAFRLDFDNSEKEIAEPLMDLKQGIEILKNNRTFKCILSTLLSVGIFLNGAPVKGFQIEYLSKVPEVKDTVHKHSLLHHLCHMVMESGNETTDLYSEIGPITRASKADFNDLAHNLSQLEHECKASWDRLKLIAKHDCPPQLKQKLVDFLADCAERIIILQVVHRRIMNRYRKFLLWLGVPQHSVADSRPNEFCRIVSEFALEYRTTRERVQQQIEKKANHRERNKTRGKLIVDIAKFKTKEDKQDAELKFLLGTPNADTPDGTLTWRRRRAENLRSPVLRQSEENFTDGDDEILESLVKTATKAPGTRTTPRERKRTRHADRKSLRRTLKNGLTEEEKLQVAALIKTY